MRNRCGAAWIRLGVASALLPSTGWAAAAAERDGLVLVHAEDFATAAALDPAFWSVEAGMFRNREAQTYAPGNVRVAGGALTLEARREHAANVGFRPDARDWPYDVPAADYTSGSVISRDAFTFGAFEVVARLPQGAGTWPAIWLISDQWPPYREVDLVEAIGHDPGLAFTNVTAGPRLGETRNWNARSPVPTLAADFHRYRLDWRPRTVTVSIDGRPVLSMDPDGARAGPWDPLRAPMHLRVNLALGGSWGGPIDDAALPARMEIRSVRVWRLEPTPAPRPATPPPAAASPATASPVTPPEDHRVAGKPRR